jgi:electron transfer flavoprotein alpha subunit
MAYEGKGIWCIAETRHGKITPTALELLTAAQKIKTARSEDITLVVVGGPGVKSAAEAIGGAADKIIAVENDALANFVDEAYANALCALIEQHKPKTILLPASVYGRSLAPRLAVPFGASLVSDIVDLAIEGGALQVKRSGYAGNVTSTVQLKGALEVITARPLAFEKTPAATGTAESAEAACGESKTEYSGFAEDTSGEIDLGAAEKIVSGGRGLGNKEGFKIIRELAQSLGAAVGASRAAVDSDWIPYKHQVGLTGRAVAPRLYVACGISGQIQHLAGMKSSDIIVAINTDADCPMMQMATFAVKGDLYKVIPALVSEINAARGAAVGA